LVDRVRPDQEGEDLSQLVSGQRVVGRARVLVRGQDVDGDQARCVLLFGPQAASRLQELGLVRGELVTQHGKVAGPLRDGAQQRVDIGGGDRCLEVQAVLSCSLDPTHGQKPT
jgi:hypothetical protein